MHHRDMSLVRSGGASPRWPSKSTLMLLGSCLALAAATCARAQAPLQAAPASASVVASQPSPESPLPPVDMGPKLSLVFKSIEVRALLQTMAELTGQNMLIADSVAGMVSLNLKDVPWSQALDIILSARGLGKRQTGNVLEIAPKAELDAREKAEAQARQSIETLEPVRTQDFKLNYAKATDIAASLMGATGAGAAARVLSPRGSVLPEVRTNQIFVTDIPSALTRVQTLIRKLDIPVRQVLIEARIVEASDSFGRSLGTRLGGRPITLNGGANSQFGGSYSVPVLVPGAPSGLGTFGATAGDFFNLPAAGINAMPAASFALSLFNSSRTRLLNLEISALEADGKGKVVSSPRIVTTDQVKALIEQGTELPYQTRGSTTVEPKVEFRKAILKLEVTPQITPEGNIILTLEVNKDSVGRVTPAGFAIDTKRVQTQVLVENGGTVAIGGIFEETERQDETKVPLLGDLPGLGFLFKNRTRSTSKSELLVFITPRLLVGSLASALP
jgi:type IV pilus assembly protein PilQ